MVKINIDVPKKMKEIAQNADAANRPYDICLHCPFMSETCDGPNVLAMEYHRWVEWIGTVAKQNKLTHSMIAERANLSKGTVDSVLSGKNQDVRAFTMMAITKAVLGGCWGQYPCHFAAQLIAGNLAEEDFTAEQLQQELTETKQKLEQAERRLANSQRRADEAKADAQKRIDFLKDQVSKRELAEERNQIAIAKKEKTILWLGLALGLLMTLVLGLFVYDAFNPNVGWFRY